jgi:hypothetical protein
MVKSLKSIAILPMLLCFCCSAKADLGDTYAISCHRYGGRGTVNGTWIVWYANGIAVAEQFRNNQCVAIIYHPRAGTSFIEGEIWRTLQFNSNPDDNWSSYHADSNGNIEYVTRSGKLYGKLFVNDSTLRVCYASWLQRHGMLTDGDSNSGDTSDKPPVEDNIELGLSSKPSS